MNWGKLFEIGLKVVVAVGAGLAVFMGVEGAMKKQQSTGNDPGNSSVGNEINTTENNNGSVVISGLRAAQNTCGKLFNLAQGLVTVAESVGAFTNKNSGYTCPSYGGYGYYPPQMQCGDGWRRINPFIIESIPPQGAPINYNSQYPY